MRFSGYWHRLSRNSSYIPFDSCASSSLWLLCTPHHTNHTLVSAWRQIPNNTPNSLHVDFSIPCRIYIIFCHCTLPRFVCVGVCVCSLWGSSARATIEKENSKFEIISGFLFSRCFGENGFSLFLSVCVVHSGEYTSQASIHRHYKLSDSEFCLCIILVLYLNSISKFVTYRPEEPFLVHPSVIPYHTIHTYNIDSYRIGCNIFP